MNLQTQIEMNTLRLALNFSKISGLFVCLHLMLIPFFCFSQIPENYTTLKSSGEVPADFTVLSTTKYRQDYQENLDTKLDQDFFLNTRFFIDELLLSGKVLFNDPISNYVRDVAHVVLGANDSLFGSLRFYTIRTNIANAFSTDQGIIFVTTGLLSRLENEAQLAFILAHEISHYTAKHTRKGYLERKKIETESRYQQLSYDQTLKQLSIYNKKNELDADAKGIELYLETDYIKSEIPATFNILLYSYLPFSRAEFDTSFFNSALLKIPGHYFPESEIPVTAKADDDDSLSTHPNIKTRSEKAQVIIKPTRFKNGTKKFVVSDSVFYAVRNLSKFESINIHLTYREYSAALYEIFVLKKEFLNSRFLDLSQIKALYGLTKYKNHDRFKELTDLSNYIEGESSRLHGFINSLSKEHLNILALRTAYDMTLKYPDDSVFDVYWKEMKIEFALYSGVQLFDLKSFPAVEYNAPLDSGTTKINYDDSIQVVKDSELPETEKSKLINELEASKNTAENPGDPHFWLFALSDLLADGEFIKELSEIKNNTDGKENEETNVVVFQESKQTVEKRPDIKNLIIVDPIYENYDLRGKRNFIKSEKTKLNISKHYEEEYKKLELQTTVLDSKFLDSSDLEMYNEIALINDWLMERLLHKDLEMISSSNERMQEICKKYNTPHFLFTGVYGYKSVNRLSWEMLLSVYAAPIALIDAITIHNYFDFVAIEINAETDQIEFIDIKQVNLKSTNTVIDAYIYNLLYELSTPSKN